MTEKWYAYHDIAGVLISEGTEDDQNLNTLPPGITRLNTYVNGVARETGKLNREYWDETSKTMVVVPETRDEIQPHLIAMRIKVDDLTRASEDAAEAAQPLTHLISARNRARIAYRRRLQDFEDAIN